MNEEEKKHPIRKCEWCDKLYETEKSDALDKLAFCSTHCELNEIYLGDDSGSN